MPRKCQDVFQHETGVVAVVTGFLEKGDRWEFEVRLRAPGRVPISGSFGVRELSAFRKSLESGGKVLAVPAGWDHVAGWGAGGS